MSNIKILQAMMSRPASKGWFGQFGGGKKAMHGSRHRRSQMKFFGTKWKGGKAKI